MGSKIIAIWGKASSGKTTTIIEISNRIQSMYKSSVEKIDYIGKKDILEILKWNNFTVGICSQGDTEWHLNRGFSGLEKHKPDIIICPTRTRGKTCEYIESKEKKYEVKWVEIPFFKKKTKEPKEETVEKVMNFVNEVYRKKNKRI